ncbi:MAG: phasin family protein [Proteobacteria bacterium]|nr:phasin family protein [Pseudomonadota bacterium]
MNDQITRQAEQFFAAAKEARLPDNVQALVADGVAKTRAAYEQAAGAAKTQAKVAEEMLLAGQAGAKSIGAKLVENTTANAEAAFEAAQAIARAKTIPEAARLQAEFVQKQMAVAGAQTRELFELSTRVAQEAFQSFNTVATKSFEQIKKFG